MSETIKVYGTPGCGDCRRAKQILEAEQVEYDWIDISVEPDAASFVERVNNGYRSVPTIIFPDGEVMVEPSSPDLARKLRSLA